MTNISEECTQNNGNEGADREDAEFDASNDVDNVTETSEPTA